jgi:hypothetical protein
MVIIPILKNPLRAKPGGGKRVRLPVSIGSKPVGILSQFRNKIKVIVIVFRHGIVIKNKKKQ